MSAPPIVTDGLVKRYGDLVAVAGVSLTVEQGDVYGFLGPNGAGKTTSLRMVLGLIRPSAGRALLFGRDPQLDGARSLDGVAGFVEAPRFYPYLSGRKNLELCAAFDRRGSAGIDEALDQVELRDRAGDRVGGYSHGMRQRLGIAAALVRRPQLLILDEPTTGLDPAGIRDMKDLVRRLAAGGMTIVFSSHQLVEVEELCNRVAIVQRGAILYEGGLRELVSQTDTRYRLRTSDDGRAAAMAAAHGLDALPSLDGTLVFEAAERDMVELTRVLGAAGVGIRALVPEQATLEQLFFRLTEGVEAPEQAPETVRVA